MRTTRKARGAFIGLLITASFFAVAVVGAPVGVAAQSDALQSRIERIERELRDLERDFYRGGAPSSGGGGAAMGGGGEDASLSVRMSALEDSLRSLTGQIEQLNYRMSQLDSRLAAVEVANNIKPPPAMSSGGEPTVLSKSAAAQAAAGAQSDAIGPGPQVQPSGPSQSPPPNKGVETLGTTTPSAAAGAAAGAAVGDKLPPGDENAQFAAAVDILYRGDNESGAAALRSFISQHPKSPKIGEAYYWLGEAELAQKAYREAAEAFLTTVQKHPKDPKAPQALVKLGVTLIQGGQKTEGCKQLKTVKSVFPKASQDVLDMAARERSRVGCT